MCRQTMALFDVRSTSAYQGLNWAAAGASFATAIVSVGSKSGSALSDRSRLLSGAGIARECTTWLERRAHQYGIARGLQRAARGEKHQDRQPQPGIAVAAQRPPAAEIERKRCQHEVAHVARPGRAYVDSIIGVGEGAEHGRHGGEQEKVIREMANLG